MNRATPSMATIASAYGINRAQAYRIARRHSLSVAELADPEIVFSRLLKGRTGKLRTMLASPATRENIKNSLK